MRPVTGAGGYRMSETQPIGIHQAIRHQADIIPFGQRFHDGVPSQPELVVSKYG